VQRLGPNLSSRAVAGSCIKENQASTASSESTSLAQPLPTVRRARERCHASFYSHRTALAMLRFLSTTLLYSKSFVQFNARASRSTPPTKGPQYSRKISAANHDDPNLSLHHTATTSCTSSMVAVALEAQHTNCLPPASFPFATPSLAALICRIWTWFRSPEGGCLLSSKVLSSDELL
jgi:hypothetical protein